ncbi:MULTISPECIES: non-hydrolyzing UDP-N-acetylglucosamine 2-epimerase [unclassified Arthrobacter]|uniref:non-hydrolyzing UDP-N-acetylglucosamine 2-epimerase n=1 Tax=unclassified Arthrobacter TaxID=235627 RepID=UPI0021045288|nr:MULTISPECIES: UDP-N-acetylglucosamine 2-epimerase (non-hydrolyzing) [unclassified Arthrobacter]MCQ1945384.1 UDP-N-acetylglucosamine 2-epimerase (non-hydrolyzing) [Arthrobacter sp. zg-Y1116]MCQ1985330.1 UDP-N-acetylglucosamine 2-epimerase (non-hydrolyzing) [Arthrobacter sp. zg-Y844]MCQ1994955.1 UDP-N-acetylglucosamine 2-epimerase (non-hydrolyzing) [Arthrobacter sp. zg-Y1171]UWX80986.1 UDP-N-acetylglucosamine 2-epimerase (non-hydrolyzing) [Arthrobacter sp. zg-Y1171]
MNTPSRKLKVLTVVGTRPEIIRLAATIRRLDRSTEHVLVHTGQNYDYELNEVFFEDLGLRRPDHFLAADTSSLGAVLGSILAKLETVLLQEKPDAMVVLGDTNSCISALIARRLKVPVYHMEAGNRCFDENVPEEVNRRLVDHVADYNLVYTEHARRNLLAEGIHPSRILLTGSPMREVLEANAKQIAESNILADQGLTAGEYFLVSLHREENVDNPKRLKEVLGALQHLAQNYGLPVLVSTHPRTRKRLEDQPEELKQGLRFHAPFGFNDYVQLQMSAKLVLSDSGTISEESSILGFPAVTLRDWIERPESLDSGVIITTGVETDSIVDAIEIVLDQAGTDGLADAPAEYQITDTSRRTVNFIRSTAHSHHRRAGLNMDKA